MGWHRLAEQIDKLVSDEDPTLSRLGPSHKTLVACLLLSLAQNLNQSSRMNLGEVTGAGRFPRSKAKSITAVEVIIQARSDNREIFILVQRERLVTRNEM